MNELTNIENPKILMKNNVLIQAKYSLTLVENRIFLLMMYKLQRESEGVLSCQISHDEFKLVIKHAKDKTIKSISNSLSNLRKKSIFFMEEKEKGKGIIWGEYGFLNGFIYDEETKTFKIEASQKIYDLLNTYLQTGYTPANLAVLFSMKNYYAQRLYDLLRLWSGTKSVINYNIKDLKMYLQLEDSYPEYGNFKRRVITPAIKELNETGYFEVEFKENKVGRKVESLDFLVKDLDRRKYFGKNLDESIECTNYEVINDIVQVNEKENRNSPKDVKLETDIYIPDESIFSKGTIRLFKNDFKDYDFGNILYHNAFEDAVAITLERDDVEVIEVKSYKYFKGALINRIDYYKKEIEENQKYQEEMSLYWWNDLKK
ncbi:MAG: replication initiation protein [Romboutsia sp.]|uniref:replication initiation protein n=1 Tax=Romboutsia sp. TaxID=1965302 RepID=UPI003F303BBF